MNPKEEFVRCQYCNKKITLESPPSKKRYEKAEIMIGDGSILLPARIVEMNHKEGYSDSHSADLSGHYCGPKCLRKMIKRILGEEKNRAKKTCCGFMIDDTKKLLADIILWEKDLSEYDTLEKKLRSKYVILKR
jgi:hypothetical protein